MASTEVLIGVVVGTIVGVILSILIIVFLLFWLGFCHCPGGDDDLRDEDDSRDENRRNNSDAAARQRQQRQYKGIPLNTVVRPLSAAEQEERDRVIARYKRRKAREERRAAREQRRQARAAARAATAANGAAVVAGVEGEGKAMNVEGQTLHRALPVGREGSNGVDVTPNHNMNSTTTIAMHGEGVEGGGAAAGLTRRSSFASTMNTLTTTTATTALTSSAVAYGRGEYLPYDGDEYDEGEENDHNSYYNNNNSERRRGRRRSTSHRGTAAGGHSGRASETEMVPVSAAASSCGRHSSLSRHTLATLRGYVRELGRQRRLRRKARRRHGAGDGDGEVDILNQWETSLGRSSSSSSSLTSSSSSGGGSVGRRSVASSMPRPPEEILGRNAFTTRYSGITGMTSQPAPDHTSSPAPHTVNYNSQGRSETQQYTAPTTTTGVQKADNNNLMKTSHANAATAAALHSTSTPASREPTHDSEAEELAGAVSQRELHHHTTHTSQQQQAAAAVVVVGPQSQPREAEHVYYNAHTQLSLVQQQQPLVVRPLQSLGQPGKAQPTAVDTATTAGSAVRQYVDAHHIDLTQSSAFGQHEMSEEERDAEGHVGSMTHGQHASHPYTNTNNNTNKSNAKQTNKNDDEGSSTDSSSILVLGHRAPTAQGTSTTAAGGRYGDEPHTSSHAATITNNHTNSNNATVDVRRRKWTGRDVEQNVALSGFFAAPMQNSLELQPRPRRSSVLHNTPDLNNTITTRGDRADVMQTAVVGATQRSAEEPASAAAVRGGGTNEGEVNAAAATGEAKKAAESK